MTQDEAICLIKDYGTRQRGTHLPCPCCGQSELTYQTSKYSRFFPTSICEVCDNGVELPPEQWAITQHPKRWNMVREIHCFVGRFNPIRRGYVVVEATSSLEAKAIFHKAYPGIGAIFADGCSDDAKARSHYYGTIHYRGGNIPPLTETNNDRG
ncbi:MAG: hypothetical protein IJ357_00645 [Oscillospiraceae bacterium]|nr:hypothetical protein [Oscillospiraceae bacterium]